MPKYITFKVVVKDSLLFLTLNFVFSWYVIQLQIWCVYWFSTMFINIKKRNLLNYNYKNAFLFLGDTRSLKSTFNCLTLPSSCFLRYHYIYVFIHSSSYDFCVRYDFNYRFVWVCLMSFYAISIDPHCIKLWKQGYAVFITCLLYL